MELNRYIHKLRREVGNKLSGAGVLLTACMAACLCLVPSSVLVWRVIDFGTVRK